MIPEFIEFNLVNNAEKKFDKVTIKRSDITGVAKVTGYTNRCVIFAKSIPNLVVVITYDDAVKQIFGETENDQVY